jgi:hypothetical protein
MERIDERLARSVAERIRRITDEHVSRSVKRQLYRHVDSAASAMRHDHRHGNDVHDSPARRVVEKKLQRISAVPRPSDLCRSDSDSSLSSENHTTSTAGGCVEMDIARRKHLFQAARPTVTNKRRPLPREKDRQELELREELDAIDQRVHALLKQSRSLSAGSLSSADSLPNAQTLTSVLPQSTNLSDEVGVLIKQLSAVSRGS